MKTRISAFCDTVLEAGWLLALVVVPIFFNLFSSRVFEPDKIALLRSIATLMAVALLVKWIEETEKGTLRNRLVSTMHKPLVLPTLFIAFVYLLATIVSVSPRVSLWGSYQRLQGTYTWFSYLIIFAAMLSSLRKREQLNRLLNTLVLASLPVALYGIVQHYQLDPLPWGGDVTFRVASNMGNAIFVAAYLIMVIPLSINRLMTLNRQSAVEAPTSAKLLHLVLLGLVVVQTLIWSVGGFWWGLFGGLAGTVLCWFIAERRNLPLAALLLNSIIGWTLSAQLTCVFYSQSRGPWLGLVAGLALFALLLTYTKGWRKGLYAVLALTVLLAGALGWLNLSSSALADRIREVPYVGRLGELLSNESETSQVRLLIWEGAVDMVFDDPVRTLVGYGPETMYVAYPPFYNPDLAHLEHRNATPDRSHNEMFDTLTTTGLIGFAAYILLFVSVFYLALKWLGLIPDKQHRNLFITLLCASGALGVVLPLLVDGGLRYMGVGVPLALLGGIGIYALVMTLRHGQNESIPLDPWRVALIISILAAITAHWVEIHLGIAIVSTRTVFWTLAGVLVVVGTGSIVEEEVIPIPRAKARARKTSHRQPEHNGGIVAGILAGLIGCVLIWDYVTNPNGLTDAISVLWQSFTTMAASGHAETINLAILGLIVASVSAVIVALVAQEKAEKNTLQASWGKSLGTAVVIAGIIMLSYGFYHASKLDSSESLPNLIYGFAVLMLGFWIALSLALKNKSEKLSVTDRSPLAYLGIPLALGGLIFCSTQNLSEIKADIVYKEGLRYDSAELWEQAAGLYATAVELNPTEDYYMLFEGRALLQMATEETDASTQEAYFAQALDILEKAADTAPLNPDHAANIARLYSRWAAITTNSDLLQERRELCVLYYEKASELSPHNVGILNEWAIALAELERYDEAMALLDHSLELDPIYAETYQAIGEIYYRQQDWSQALNYYEKAAGMDETDSSLTTAVAHCYANLEQWDTATEWYSRTVELAPDSGQAWLYLGNSQENTGDLLGAESAYLQANALVSGSETVLRRLIAVSLQLSDLNTAESALLQLGAVAPNDWTVYHDLAIVYSEEGLIDQALEQIDTALSLASATEDVERIQELQSQIQAQEDTP